MSGVIIKRIVCIMYRFKLGLTLLALCFSCAIAWAEDSPDDKAVTKWVQEIIRPLFLTNDQTKIENYVSENVLNDTLEIKKSLEVYNFGTIEIEQKATIDGTPAWRIIVDINAKQIETGEKNAYTLRLLVLKNKSGEFKITHIHQHERKTPDEKE